jgi:hypothetical protein
MTGDNIGRSLHRLDADGIGTLPCIAQVATVAAMIEIGSGENAIHPGHCAGSRGVDAFDQCMPVWRAQHDAVQLAGHSDVVHIAPLPGEKSLVFVPPRRALARDRVRHAGDPVAFVVADRVQQAWDAAERIAHIDNVKQN